MMRVVCALPFDVGKDAGAGDMEKVKQWCREYPELRPCGLHHGWVEKARACRRCRECKQLIEE